MSQTTKDSVRITGHGQTLAMPITRSLMQTCRVVCIQQPKNTRREREKAKKQRLKDRGKRGKAKEQQGPSCLWRGRSESRRTEKVISKEQKKYQEELQVAGRQYVEGKS